MDNESQKTVDDLMNLGQILRIHGRGEKFEDALFASTDEVKDVFEGLILRNPNSEAVSLARKLEEQARAINFLTSTLFG
jgi:hypothetical protein